eukprot:UN10817
MLYGSFRMIFICELVFIKIREACISRFVHCENSSHSSRLENASS